MLSHYRRLVKPRASLYVCHPPAWQREFQNALESAGFTVGCQIVWARQSPAQGSGHYKPQHELIFHAHVSGQTDVWYGDKRQSTVWTQDQPAHSPGKPVELVERALRNSSQKGGLVTDLSASSGSTLIACERLGTPGTGDGRRGQMRRRAGREMAELYRPGRCVIGYRTVLSRDCGAAV